MGGGGSGWPIGYDDLAPFYSEAEQFFDSRTVTWRESGAILGWNRAPWSTPMSSYGSVYLPASPRFSTAIGVDGPAMRIAGCSATPQ